MAYDEDLADRIRSLMGRRKHTEKKMFGGLAFLVGGNMSIAASGQGGLLVRCDPAETATLLRLKGVEPFVMRGKAMDGWLRVETTAVRTDKALATWIDRGVAYAGSLPAKG
jgi:TfoX/Sxy family transcriptional regulator of competence genes